MLCFLLASWVKWLVILGEGEALFSYLIPITLPNTNWAEFRAASVQFSSVDQSCPTLCDPMNRSTPGLPAHHHLPEFTQTHVHRVRDAIQPSHPLSSPSPPAPNPSQHQSLFQLVNSSHEVAKVLEFSFSIIPSKEHAGLISFRMDWLDFLAVQGSLKNLLQHHSSKASILRRSVFFIVQLSHPYMTTGKTITLTRWTFVGKVMSLFFNKLSRLVITFLPRSKRLLISWLFQNTIAQFKLSELGICSKIYLFKVCEGFVV